ncbi:unnamed protein product, partial [Acanthoscelides obtectus]
ISFVCCSNSCFNCSASTRLCSDSSFSSARHRLNSVMYDSFVVRMDSSASMRLFSSACIDWNWHLSVFESTWSSSSSSSLSFDRLVSDFSEFNRLEYLVYNSNVTNVNIY